MSQEQSPPGPAPRINRIASDFDVFRGRPQSSRTLYQTSEHARSTSRLREEIDSTEGSRLVEESPFDDSKTPYNAKAAEAFSAYPLDATELSRSVSQRSRADGDTAPRPITFSKASWIGATILILAVFSTLFSLLFLLIAIFKPRYGYFIHATGKLNPNSAVLISAIFAKLIELSFVTVFVAFLGQVLSRRSLLSESKGVTMSEILMRSWITMPGSLLTTQSLRYAGPTFLGALSIFVTILTALYTTAAQSLVTPRLQWSGSTAYDLTGLVSVEYANSTTLINLCPAIVSSAQDGPVNGGTLPVSQTTCYNIHNAFPSLRDFTYLTTEWKKDFNSTTADNKTLLRPAPYTVLNSNDINYFGEWTSIVGVNGMNNVTLVLPHGGLVGAVRNVTANKMVQPDPTGDFGNCDVTASIVNPAINVLCAPLNETTIQWFISTNSTARVGTLDSTLAAWFHFNANGSVSGFEDFMTNANKLGKNGVGYESPRFPEAPAEYNSVIWQTFGYSDPSMYTLTRLNGTQPNGINLEEYTMCAIRSYLTPFCSTRYVSATGGGNVTVDCSPNNPNSAGTFFPDTDNEWQNQFKDIAGELAFALNFNGPNASISRVFTFFALGNAEAQLPTSLPSLAEALATMYTNTVVSSSVGSQFLPVAPPILPATQSFPVRGETQQYASGASSGWELAFYVVLVGVVVVNIFCLAYFIMLREMVRDWTDTGELFHVGLHSDAGGGWAPEGAELGSKWWIRQRDDGRVMADKQS